MPTEQNADLKANLEATELIRKARAAATPAGLLEELKSVTSSVSQVETKLGTLEPKVTQAETKLETLEPKVTQLETKTQELDAQIKQYHQSEAV